MEKKTTKVGSVKHEGTGMRVQLNVDRDSRLFWADVSGVRIEHSEGKELERLVLEAIDRSMAVEWTPFIYVHPWTTGGSNEYSVFGFKADRRYYAKLPEGVGMRSARWDAKDDKQRLAWSEAMAWRVTDGEFKPPCVRRGYSGDASYYLPYTDEVWDRLVSLRAEIERASAAFLAILESPDPFLVLSNLQLPIMSLASPEPAAD